MLVSVDWNNLVDVGAEFRSTGGLKADTEADDTAKSRIAAEENLVMAK